jgi:hypothetical protein
LIFQSIAGGSLKIIINRGQYHAFYKQFSNDLITVFPPERYFTTIIAREKYSKTRKLNFLTGI